MILADWQIAARCNGGMVSPFDPALVNPASLDVRLGDTLLIESAVDDVMVPYPLAGHTEQNPYLLKPGQFVLACTIETFNLPSDTAAQFMLKSSRAREGIEHLLSIPGTVVATTLPFGTPEGPFAVRLLVPAADAHRPSVLTDAASLN